MAKNTAPGIARPRLRHLVPVIAYEPDGTVREFLSLTAAATHYGSKPMTIRRLINSGNEGKGGRIEGVTFDETDHTPQEVIEAEIERRLGYRPRPERVYPSGADAKRGNAVRVYLGDQILVFLSLAEAARSLGVTLNQAQGACVRGRVLKRTGAFIVRERTVSGGQVPLIGEGEGQDEQ